MTRKSEICSTALALVLAASAPATAVTWTYSDIDQDGNLELSESEFSPAASDLFAEWDANRDQVIGEDEFYSGLYDTWDADGDGELTEAEFDDGWNTWFSDMDQPDYGGLDSDGDGLLTENEFAQGFGQTQVYSEWTADGELSEDQFSSGLYDVYDIDDDDLITEAEYEDVGTIKTGSTAAVGTGGLTETEAMAPGAYSGVVDEGLGDRFIRAENVIGADIYTQYMEYDEDAWFETDYYNEIDTDWEEIGEISDVVFSRDGRLIGVIAEIGGWLDIGDADVVINMDDLRLVGGTYEDTWGNLSFVTRLSEEQLESRQEVDDGWW
jgi:hypothetical protein